MASKLIQFPGKRLLFQVGRRHCALDPTRSITEVESRLAPVIPIRQGKTAATRSSKRG